MYLKCTWNHNSMMFIPDMLQNAITYSCHIYHLQWNIEGMLFLFQTKRLNPNLRKKFKNKFKFLNLVLKSNFITYNVMKGIHCYLLEIQTENEAAWTITGISKRRPNHMTSVRQFDWFIIFRRPIWNFYPRFFFLFYFITHNR